MSAVRSVWIHGQAATNGAAHEGRGGDAARAETEDAAVRDPDHRAVPPTEEFGGRGADRDVSGRGFRAARGGHHGGAAGHEGESLNSQRTEPEAGRAHRRVAQTSCSPRLSGRVPEPRLPPARHGSRALSRCAAWALALPKWRRGGTPLPYLGSARGFATLAEWPITCASSRRSRCGYSPPWMEFHRACGLRAAVWHSRY